MKWRNSHYGSLLNSFFKFEFLLLIIAIIAFYQVAFLQYALKWDMIIGYGTSRYAISQQLHEGIFPLWRPFINCGYPAYGGFSATWSPFILIAGWLTNYTIITLHFFFIFYIYLAGLGMFKLIKHLIGDKKIAFITAVSYMLGGIMVSHAQHMDILASTAWLPWLFLAYFKLLSKLKWRDTIPFIIIAYITLTDGYPAVSITAVYTVVAWGVVEMLNYIRLKNFTKLKRFLLLNISSVALLLIMSIGLIYTFLEVSEEVSRYKDVHLVKKSGSAFTFQSYLSYIFPYATISETKFFNCHISFNNAYIGILLFVFGLAGLFIKRNKIVLFFLATSIFWLWAGLGEDYYLKTVLHEYLPMMNKFRTPAILRIPATFSLTIIGAYGFYFISKHKPQLLNYIVILLLFIFSIVSIIAFLLTDIQSESSIFQESSLSAHIFTQSIVHIVLLICFLIYTYIKKGDFITILMILIPIDLFVAVQLNMSQSVVSKFDPIKYHKQQISHPKGFPIPSQNLIKENTDKTFAFYPSWLSGSVYKKEVSYDGYNALILDKYRNSYNDKALSDSTICNSLAYFTTDVRPIEYRNSDSIFTNKTIYIEEPNFINFDSKANAITKQIEIIDYQPDKIEISVHTSKNQYLVLLQTNYPGWKAFIDHSETKIYTANHQFMAIYVPKGVHKIEFNLRKDIIKYTSLSNIGIVIILSIIILVINFKHLTNKQKYSILMVILLLLLLSIIRITTPKRNVQRITNYQKISELFRNWSTSIDNREIAKALLVDNHHIMREIDSNLIESHGINSKSRYYRSRNISNAIENLDTINANYLFYAKSNTFVNENVAGMIYATFPTLLKNELFDDNQVLLLSRTINQLNKRIIKTYEDKNIHASKRIDDEFAASGSFSYKIDKEAQYGGGFNFAKGDFFEGDESFIVYKGKVLMQQKTDCSLIIRFFGKDKNIQIKVKDFHITSAIDKLCDWNSILLGTKIPDNTERIEIFYHKNGKHSPLWIDDSEVILIRNHFIKTSE